MGIARRATLGVKYNNRDISKDISKFIKSFSVQEVISGEADSADITLEDREELWQGDWLPERGATVDIAINLLAWADAMDDKSLDLGKFQIDEIQNTISPNEVKLKLVSIPNNSALRSVLKTKAWEKTKLSVIAKDIADNAKLELFYDTQEDPVQERAEQSEQTDLSFLMKLCQDAGLALKVSDEKIIIFDVEKYEEAEPVLKVTKGKTAIISFSATATIHEIYKAAHVKYKHGQNEEYMEYTCTAPDKKEGLTLEINEKVENLAEAEKLAKKKLREKNKDEIQISLTIPGSFSFMASNTIELEGFHFYDGKYIITRSSHDIGSGYSTKVELRRCINGY